MVYTKEQVDHYLRKIGYTEPVELDGRTLQRLQIAHLKNIPYENLDVFHKKRKA